MRASVRSFSSLKQSSVTNCVFTGTSNYDHSDGLRFMVFDEHGRRQCTDGVLMIDSDNGGLFNILIDVSGRSSFIYIAKI